MCKILPSALEDKAIMCFGMLCFRFSPQNKKYLKKLIRQADLLFNLRSRVHYYQIKKKNKKFDPINGLHAPNLANSLIQN